MAIQDQSSRLGAAEHLACEVLVEEMLSANSQRASSLREALRDPSTRSSWNETAQGYRFQAPRHGFYGLLDESLRVVWLAQVPPEAWHRIESALSDVGHTPGKLPAG
jgi:hypothetical protein